jgi:hypothetical protein
MIKFYKLFQKILMNHFLLIILKTPNSTDMNR